MQNLFGPVAVVVVAAAAQVVALGWVAGDDLVALRPLLVVPFGVSVLAGRMRSRVAEIDDAHVDSFALFGAVAVVVPRDWRAEMDVLPVLVRPRTTAPAARRNTTRSTPFSRGSARSAASPSPTDFCGGTAYDGP